MKRWTCVVVVFLVGCAADTSPDILVDVPVDTTPADTSVDTGADLPDSTVDTATDDASEVGCEFGLVDCGGRCVDLMTDANHCGACENECPAPGENTVPLCIEGECDWTCEPGWVDNDGIPGCETPCPSGTEEYCNGLDDDCDTVADQTFPCVMGEVLDCTTTCGSLGSGTCSLTCALPTPETCTPPLEDCNGIDDDCDTLVDEDWPPGTCGPCTPDCTGRVCGDDGCGGSCGTCTPPQVCNASGQCITTCTPDCAGRDCGDDGCGGSCGTCTAPLVCDAAGQCVTTCTPDCTGRDCGDDGCGGSCGTCTAPLVCDASGHCVTTCVPDCTGRDCGGDGCGGSCGTCTSPLTCNALGVCVCIPDCGTRVCGPDPVCGLSCGTCTPPDTCDAWGACTCIPNCTGRDCGLDPTCGTSCGTCTPPATCDGFGHCTCTPDCSGLECGPDPVCGTTCGSCSPPSDTCLDTVTLRDYTGSTCVSGTCTPSYSDTICPVACIGATCVECVVDTDCDPGWECNSSNVCVMSGCPPPVGSCVNGSEDMDGCGDARTIGRASAAPGWSHSDDLCWGASDNLDEGSCSDGGDDHAYRIYMLSGERIDIELYSSWPCDIDGWDWDITFKIYQNSGCSDTACTTMERCETWISHTWSGSFTAPHDGWFFLVVDSQSSWDDRMGDYDIDVTLTCNNPPTCDC